ncbi:MAG: hypothetical protein L0Y80_12385 [Ignavibacteriae bacterium]|nr:hypothetical protein [Ignavibacteriota bacterium]
MNPTEAEQKYREIIKSFSDEQRLRITFELHEMARKLVRAGIQSQHPTWDEESVEAAVKERVYGTTTTSSAAHTRPA